MLSIDMLLSYNVALNWTTLYQNEALIDHYIQKLHVEVTATLFDALLAPEHMLGYTLILRVRKWSIYMETVINISILMNQAFCFIKSDLIVNNSHT